MPPMKMKPENTIVTLSIEVTPDMAAILKDSTPVIDMMKKAAMKVLHQQIINRLN
jgi:hypothetical protein